MTLDLLTVGLAALALFRPEPRGRTLLLLAALAMGVASASLVAAFGSASPAGLADRALDPATLTFLQGVGGLVLLSLVPALLAGRSWITIAMVAMAAGIALPFARLPGSVRMVGVAVGVLAVAALGWMLLVRLRPGRILLALDRTLLDRGGWGGWRPAPGWRPDALLLVTAGAAVLALIVPHLVTVLGGAIMAAGAAWLAAFRAGRRPWLLPVAALLVFLVLLWTLRLSGPLGGWIPSLVDGPFSPRAALRLGALTAGAGLILAGQWPWHGATVPVLMAPVAVAVVGGFGARLIPDGLQWWQPILAPLTLVAMMHAVAHRRWDQLLVAVGLFGLWTATRAGAGGGSVLVAVAWLHTVASATWLGRLAVPPVAVRLAGLVPVVAGVFILRAGLASEVGYTLLAAVVVAIALGTAGSPRGKLAVAADGWADHISR